MDIPPFLVEVSSGGLLWLALGREPSAAQGRPAAAGVTPEFPDGTYYYCLTEQFPFLPRLWRGVPDESFAKSGPPPGDGPGRRPPFLGPGPDRSRGFPVPPLLKVLDQNSDGALDAAEMSEAPAALRTLDSHRDGRLSRGELQPAPPSGRRPDSPIPHGPPPVAPRPE